MVAVAAVAVAALVGAPLGVNAYINTVPLVAWGSKQSNALDALPSKPSHVTPLLEEMLVNDEACEFDVVVLAKQSGLHASDLRRLPSDSPLVRAIRGSPSRRQFQYLSTRSKGKDTEDILDLGSISEALAARCGSHPSAVRLGQSPYVSENSKSVMTIEMTSLEGKMGRDRSEQVAWDASMLSSTVDNLLDASRSVLVIYTGYKPDFVLQARQDTFDAHTGGLDDPVRPGLAEVFPDTSFGSKAFAPSKKGGILHHYQLLTPGLIISLLVVIFILLPVPMLAFRALASIQSPLSKAGQAPKGFNAGEKKNQ